MKQKTLMAAVLLVLFIRISVPSFAKEDFLNKAQKSMDLMDYDQAIYYYEQVLIENPLKQEIRPRLGFCYFRTGKHEDVVRVCQDELSRFPGSLPARILLAYVYFHQGKSEEMVAACKDFHNALEQYFSNEEQKVRKEHKEKRGSQWRLTTENREVLRKKILKKHSNLGLPYFILGVHYKKYLDFDKSSQNIHQAILWEYDPKECHTQLIDIELFQNKWEQALEKARSAFLALGPQAEFYFLMGYSYYQMDQFDRAETSFTNAFELKPYKTETLKNLGKVHLVTGNFQEATRLFKQVIKASPFDYNVKFLFERASKTQRVTKLTQRPKLSKNISERPSLKFTYTFESNIASVTDLINGAALTLLRKGQLDDAIVITERFLEIHGLSPELNYNLAHFYNIKNDLDNALKYAWIAAELKEDFKDAYDLIGNIFFKLEDFDNSIKAYRRVIASDPKDAMSHYNLGCVFSAQGEVDEAEESWLNAVRYEQSKRTRNRDQVSDDELSFSLVVVGRRVAFKSHTALGDLYKNQKMWQKALEQFQLALDLEPNRSELHYEIGTIHIEKDNISEAIKSFERYVYYGGAKEQEVRELLDTLKYK
jgi:tetratricopeptide (TPR) repeat protein